MSALACVWCGSPIDGPVIYKGRVKWGEPKVERLIYACNLKEIGRTSIYPMFLCAHDFLVIEGLEISLKIIPPIDLDKPYSTPPEVIEINLWCRKNLNGGE